MRAGWIVKVGAAIALTFSTLNSQGIPTDYWSGRLIGSDQWNLEFTDAKRGDAAFRFALGIGAKGKYEMFFPNYATYWPNSDQDRWSIDAANIGGALQLPFRTRYYLERLDRAKLKDAQDLRISGSPMDEDGIVLEHRVEHWSGVSTTFAPELSCYLFLKGVHLSAGQYRVQLCNTLARIRGAENRNGDGISTNYDYSYALQISQIFHETAFDGLALIGLSHWLQLEIGAAGGSSKQARGSTQLTDYFDDAGDTAGFVGSVYGVEIRNSTAVVRPTLTWLFKSNFWMSIATEHGQMRDRNEYLRLYYCQDVCGREESTLDKDDYRYKWNAFDLSFSWLSAGRALERGYLLDNYSGYYGKELPEGTIVITLGATWRENRNCSNSEYNDLLNSGASYVGSDRSLSGRSSLWATFEYWVLRNFSTGIRMDASRSSYPFPDSDELFSITQRNQISLALTYRNYAWDPAMQRAIGWEGVSDLDYNAQPLLQQGDFRAALNCKLPELRTWHESKHLEIVGFQLGSFGRDWQIGLNTSYGVIRAINLTWWGTYVHERRQVMAGQVSTDDFDFGAKLQWQPLRSARFSGYVNRRLRYDTYYFPVDDDSPWTSWAVGLTALVLR